MIISHQMYQHIYILRDGRPPGLYLPQDQHQTPCPNFAAFHVNLKKKNHVTLFCALEFALGKHVKNQKSDIWAAHLYILFSVSSFLHLDFLIHCNSLPLAETS